MGKVRGKPGVIVPAILYGVPLPSPLKVEAYQFVFVPSVKGEVDYKIATVPHGEVKTEGILKQQPAKQQTTITWECQDASDGWYQLLITFRFQRLFRPPQEPLQEVNIRYEFYHKAEIQILKP